MIFFFLVSFNLITGFCTKYQENWVNRHTRVWLEAWSTTETDSDVLGSVSSKASSMFSWGKTGRLTEPLMPSEDANQQFLQENSKSRYGKNKYAQLGGVLDPFKKPRWLTGFGALGYYLSVEGNNNLFGKSFRTLLIETKCHSCEDKDSNLTVLLWLFLCRLKNMLIINPAPTAEIC